MSVELEFDLGPLTWIKGELDNALDAATAALTAWNGEDLTPLKAAAAHLHQVYGALRIVDLQGVSQLTSETERLLADMGEHADKRHPETAETVLRAIAALKSYLDGLMAGAPHAELKLTPIFQEVAARRGAEPPAPSELFYPDTGLRVTRTEPELALDEAALARAVRTARRQYQRGLLLFLQNRNAAAGLMQMEQAVRQVERLAPGLAQYTFWWSVGGLMEVLRQQRIPADVWLKRVCGRVDLQMRRLMEGSRQLAERLFRDVLYYVAQDDSTQGRAAQTREHFQLQYYFPAEVSAPLSDQLSHLAQLKENLGIARDHWVRYCSGRTDSLEPFQHAAMAVFEASVRLPNAAMQSLARMIQAIAKRLPGVADATQNEALQLEMATGLLLALNAAEHFKALGEEFDKQSEVLTMRLQAAIDPAFDTSRIPEVDLLDEYSRKAQEKLVVAQVTHEIQANLNAVEELLDRFFRDANERGGLPMVPGLMKQILGALNILQLDVAADLVNEAILRIQHFTETDAHIAPENLDWVAEALSTLGMYMDALRYGRDDSRAMAGLLARPEVGPAAEASVESQIRAETERLKESVEEWAAAGADAEGREALKSELGQLARDADLVGDAGLRSQADAALRALGDEAAPEAVMQAVEGLGGAGAIAPAPSAESVRLAAESAETIDRELLATYIEEANEVLGGIAVQTARLNVSPYDFDAFTYVRRGFHTLKGSGRMVGMHDLAEVAWEVEQTLNAWLRDEKAPNPEMLRFMEEAADAFQVWVTELDEQGRARVEAGSLMRTARRLRGAEDDGGEPPPKSEAGAPEADAGDAGQPSGGEDAGPGENEAREQTVAVGPHELPAELFHIFTDEAAQRLQALREALAEMAKGHRPAAWENFIRAAHTLAGISRTTGFAPLAEAAHAVELWAGRWPDKTLALTAEANALLEEILGLLRESVAGILERRFPEAQPRIAQALAELDAAAAATQSVPLAVVESPVPSRAVDELDEQLLPVFLEEAHELMPRIGEALRAWRADPAAIAPRDELKRALHTLKGSSRMAGAMLLGEAVHALETRILGLGGAPAGPAFIDEIEAEYDRQADLIERLRGGEAAATGVPPRQVETPVMETPPSSAEPAAVADQAPTHPIQAMPASSAEPEETRIAPAAAAPISPPPPRAPVAEEPHARRGARLKADILDTLLNEAGEVAIARARIENVLNAYKLTTLELASNVERLRGQLRELEIQAETQMRSRLSQVDESQFDPLEFDRFSRLQELTRLMAESVNDVSTAQDSLLAGLNEADSALIQQSRMSRTLQEELMHLRMVPLSALAERLHRVVRQAARETGKRARLELDGGQTDLDRAVLDKIAAPLEHLVRNAVAHGLESPQARLEAGKDEVGEVRLSAAQEGNEIVLALADDGAGVNFAAVRARAIALGWIAPEEEMTAERLEQFLFRAGFSTAETVTEVAGRGIGLDVVRNEIAGIGGRVRLATEAGRGSRFTIRLPLTLAMTQVVLARAGGQTYALHANLITLVREVRADQVHALHEAGVMEFAGETYPLRTLAELVGRKAQPDDGRFRTILFLKAGEQRVAVRVDAMEGNFEAVVKNIGPQLARIAGISGATVLGDGRVALILNPFQLAERAPRLSVEEEAEDAREGSLVLVVDDSLTVRKITSRFLTREGFRVATARDGVEALEMLEKESPAIMLLDIEMPRMDGFEVARSVRGDTRHGDLPIIMITSRTAEKHRRHARELGVDAYLGKPYQEEELLAEIRRLTGTAVPA